MRRLSSTATYSLGSALTDQTAQLVKMSTPLDAQAIANTAVGRCLTSSDIRTCAEQEVASQIRQFAVDHGLPPQLIDPKTVDAMRGCVAKFSGSNVAEASLSCAKDAGLIQLLTQQGAEFLGIPSQALTAAASCVTQGNGDACNQGAATVAATIGCTALTGGVGAPLCAAASGPIVSLVWGLVPDVVRGTAGEIVGALISPFHNAYDVVTDNCFNYTASMWQPILWGWWSPTRWGRSYSEDVARNPFTGGALLTIPKPAMVGLAWQVADRIKSLRVQMGLPADPDVEGKAIDAAAVDIATRKYGYIAYDAPAQYRWAPPRPSSNPACNPSESEYKAYWRYYQTQLANLIAIPYQRGLNEHMSALVARATAEYAASIEKAKNAAITAASKIAYEQKKVLTAQAQAAGNKLVQTKLKGQGQAAAGAAVVRLKEDQAKLFAFAAVSVLAVAFAAHKYKQRRKVR